MLSIEVFAAKDEVGRLLGVMLAVPVNCGLRHAAALRIVGSEVVAFPERSSKPIDLPLFDDEALGYLRQVAQTGVGITVAEFSAMGVVDSYVLALEVEGVVLVSKSDQGAAQ